MATKETKLSNEQKLAAYEKMVERSKKYAERSRYRNQLLADKAKKAGIVVTEAEVDAAIKAAKAKK